MQSLKKIVVVPDTHAPYHSERAWRLFLKATRSLKPHTIVIIGDFADCYSISRFTKSPERKLSLKSELDTVNTCLNQLQAIGADQYIFCEGNHEWRLERYLCERAPELYGLIDIRELLKIDKRKWKWVKYQSWTKIGDMSFSHDVGRSGINSGRQTLQEFGGNITFGHSHRGGLVYETSLRGEQRCSLNVGWLGDVDQIDYRHRASAIRNSQHGFGLVTEDSQGRFGAQFVPIINERLCIVNDKRIAL